MQLIDQATQITLKPPLAHKLPETFDSFPLLPPELRHMIWRCALPGPQILTLNVLDEEDWEKDTYSILNIDRKGDGK